MDPSALRHPFDDGHPHAVPDVPFAHHRWDPDDLRSVDWADVARSMCSAVAVTYTEGWQPADLVWSSRRDPWTALLARLAVLAEAETSAPPDRWAPPRWRHQLDAIAGALEAARHPHRCASDAAGGVDRLVGHLQLTHDDLGAEHLIAHLRRLHPLPRLVSPPPSWPDACPDHDDAGDGVAPEVLARVRALLAKAESTDHPPEAEAFTAKAQELVTRHAIDAALLMDEEPPGDDDAVGRRIHIGRPYVRPKSVLVAQVAAANRCRTVIDPELELVTVFGHPADLDLVEVLFTSLLVQATASVVGQGQDAEVGSRWRSRRFRSSFLGAFAMRIGERLRSATEGATEAARRHGSGGALPVLARREGAAEAAVAEHFPRTSRLRLTASDATGRQRGRRAADHADLGPGPRLDHRPGALPPGGAS